MGHDHEPFDRKLLHTRRDRQAGRAIANEFLLARVADDFIERLAGINRRFAVGVNLGAHHGLLGRRLRRAGVELVVDLEAAPGLAALCEGPVVRGDEELLPFAVGSLDLVVSGLSLQFVNDLPGTLVQIRRALKPDGLFLGALLGGRTLFELREALLLSEAELEGGASPRVAPAVEVGDLGRLLQRAEFALPVVDADAVTVTYASPLALMHELRAMGATNVLHARRRTAIRRATLARALEIYRERHGAGGDRVRATFEILTMTGWAPHESQQKPLAPGSARMRLADALGTREFGLGSVRSPAGPRPKERS